MGRLLAYGSRLEPARIMLADFAVEVVGMATQPSRLVGSDGGRTRRHVPGILLVDADGGVTVVDVKAPDRLADPEVQAVFAWTRAAVRRGAALLDALDQPAVGALIQEMPDR